MHLAEHSSWGRLFSLALGPLPSSALQHLRMGLRSLFGGGALSFWEALRVMLSQVRTLPISEPAEFIRASYPEPELFINRQIVDNSKGVLPSLHLLRALLTGT